MIVGTVYMSVETSQGLSVILDVLTFGFFVFMVMYFVWRIFWGVINFNAKKPKED